MMIKVVSFYKDVKFKQEKNRKLKARNSFDYKKCQWKLFQTLERFNNGNCEFIASTDEITQLPEYPTIERNKFSNRLLMECVAIANYDFIQNNQGQIIFLGADHLFCNNPDILYEDEFDIALLITNKFDPSYQTNINNTIVVVNSHNDNIEQVREFFLERLKICMNLPEQERRWYADQKSLSLLLEEEGIITEFYKTRETIYNFRGLKIKLIPWQKQYLKVVGKNGGYIKADDDVIIDFCGGPEVKKHLNKIYDNIMESDEHSNV